MSQKATGSAYFLEERKDPLEAHTLSILVDTFATVVQTDRSWTEKVCAMACAKDGSLYLGFGLGKYTNRNVMDAFAGVAVPGRQWNFRASRRLRPDPLTTRVGPLEIHVIEGLRRHRLDGQAALRAHRRRNPQPSLTHRKPSAFAIFIVTG